MTSPIEPDWSLRTVAPAQRPPATTGDEPPSYRETVANTGYGASSGTEQRRPLLPAESTRRSTSSGPQPFNINKFVLLWMGVGYPYSFCCCLLHLIFFGVGITAIVFSVVKEPPSDLDVARVLTVAAGFSFVVLGSLWPCTWFFHNRSPHRFTPVICYAWILSTFFVGIGGALASQVYEHFHTMTHDHAYTAQIPLWTVVSMGGIVSLFAIITGLLCACYPLAGQIW